MKEKLEVVWVGLDMLTLNVSRECVWGRLKSNKLERKKGWDTNIIERNGREGFWQARKRECYDRLERRQREDEILIGLT